MREKPVWAPIPPLTPEAPVPTVEKGRRASGPAPLLPALPAPPGTVHTVRGLRCGQASPPRRSPPVSPERGSRPRRPQPPLKLPCVHATPSSALSRQDSRLPLTHLLPASRPIAQLQLSPTWSPAAVELNGLTLSAPLPGSSPATWPSTLPDQWQDKPKPHACQRASGGGGGGRRGRVYRGRWPLGFRIRASQGPASSWPGLPLPLSPWRGPRFPKTEQSDEQAEARLPGFLKRPHRTAAGG